MALVEAARGAAGAERARGRRSRPTRPGLDPRRDPSDGAEANRLPEAVLHRARDDVRRAVARELHDEVGQLLAAIRLSLAEVVGCVDDDERVRRGDRLELLIADAIESVRSLTFQLRQATPTSVAADRVGDGVDVVDVAQLVGALEGLADRIFRPRSIECAVRCRCPAHEVGAAIESSLVSVVRELFVNVVRHAHATAVSVSIVEAAGRLRLTVVDDGVGMPGDPVPGQRSGCGLEIVDERLREVGGSMRFDQVRRGTSITVTAPLTRTCVPPPG